MKNKEAFVVTKGEQFCNVDYSSGGYPYFVNEIFRAKFFGTLEEAFDYANKFDDLIVKKVNIEVVNFFTNIKE